ncbi:protein lifeguard 1 [Hypomesus transpacificus]|uniref:protein lifeguard 1 n=1 Tax=Hypomesus transpacificus TaxID=137520 RepID=UPI001F07B37F|nr:protein lifeguard 1 [Hypomesus transpacificus]
MAETENYSAPEETQDFLSSDGLEPPPYTFEDTQTDPTPACEPPAYYPPDSGPSIDPTEEYQPEPHDGDPGCDKDTTESTPELASSPFDDKTVRRAFIRKVFGLVTLQLVVTFSIVSVFTFSSVVKKAVQSNIWIYVSSVIIFLVVSLSLIWSRSFSRKHPWNLVGLAVVTLSLSFMTGTVASFHDSTAVVIAMGATLAISFSIILFSIQNCVSFTVCYGALLVILVDLVMFLIFCTFYYNNVLQIVYGCLGALLFALFLSVDCMMVVSLGRYGLDPEEYVFAALIIYLDVVMIFLYILGKR